VCGQNNIRSVTTTVYYIEVPRKASKEKQEATHKCQPERGATRAKRALETENEEKKSNKPPIHHSRNNGFRLRSEEGSSANGGRRGERRVAVDGS